MEQQERRFIQRFAMQQPAIVRSCMSTNGGERHLLLTRDISSCGAYFNSSEPLDYTGQVEVEVLINVPGSEDRGNYLSMITSGEIVRCEATGLAVRFKEEPSLKPFHL